MRDSKADLKLVNLTKPTGDSRGLEPYLALEPRRHSKPRATDYWLIDAGIVIGAFAAMLLVLYGIAHKMGAL